MPASLLTSFLLCFFFWIFSLSLMFKNLCLSPFYFSWFPPMMEKFKRFNGKWTAGVDVSLWNLHWCDFSVTPQRVQELNL
jgi:hypothetical protein